MGTAYSYLSRIAAYLRESGTPVSSAGVIEAVRLALELARMRGGKIPALRDLRDAAVTCLGEGSLAAVSLAVMLGLKRTGRFSILGVSAAGGVGHNIGQILVAMAVLRSGYAAGYLPVLLVSGVSAGAAVGAAGGVVARRVRP